MNWGKYSVYTLVLLLSMVAVSALDGPYTVNGKEYYVVSADDPSEDSGIEVCAKLGQTCVGFTETTGDACAQANPGSASATALSGDQSTVYCDGSPQTGVCAGYTNTCVTCPTCSVSVGCSQPIGNLYQEMFVECKPPTTSTCPVTLFARDTDQFLNEIPTLNAALGSCPATLPSGSGFLVGTGDINVEVLRNNGRTDSFSATLQNKQITGVSSATSTSCSQTIKLSESTFDTILGSRDRSAAFMRAYTNKEVTVSGCTVVRKTINFFVQPFARFFVGQNTPPPPAPTPPNNCGQLNEQCNNRACATGLTCASPRTFQGGRWVAADFRCIDQQQYDAYCVAPGNTRPAWDCLAGSYCR